MFTPGTCWSAIANPTAAQKRSVERQLEELPRPDFPECEKTACEWAHVITGCCQPKRPLQNGAHLQRRRMLL